MSSKIEKGEQYKTKGVANREKLPLILSIKNEVYDGKKTWTISKEELKEMRQFPMRCKYVVIPVDQGKTLEETYEEFIKDADILKEETKGFINLYKTGTNAKTASKLFEYFSGSILAEKLEQDEADWIQNASIAALVFAEKYEGPLYEYDICSMYPSIMADSKMLFPLKRGEFKTYTQKELKQAKFFHYGIYRCEISKSGDNKIDRLFRFNKKNYYTHFCLKRARELGLDIKIIDDGEANVLIYSRDCLINGNLLFYKYVQFLFSLKERQIAPKRTKGILNILWGYLTRMNIYTRTCKDDDDIFEIPINGTLVSLCPLDDGRTVINYIPDNKNMFETNFARIKPFLLAKGRYIISTIIEPHNKIVVRSHTDSLLSTIPIKFPKAEHKRGSIVLKQSSKHAKIHNNIKVDW